MNGINTLEFNGNMRGKCVIDDIVNDFVGRAESADGFIFGSPVHYAAAGGAITSFMDRSFFSARQSKRDCFYLKPREAGEKAGVPLPLREDFIPTNFIR